MWARIILISYLLARGEELILPVSVLSFEFSPPGKEKKVPPNHPTLADNHLNQKMTSPYASYRKVRGGQLVCFQVAATARATTPHGERYFSADTGPTKSLAETPYEGVSIVARLARNSHAPTTLAKVARCKPRSKPGARSRSSLSQCTTPQSSPGESTTQETTPSLYPACDGIGATPPT